MSYQLDMICFGGAFDPVHIGHVEAVKIAHEAFPESKIILVPSFCPPKSAQDVKSVATDFIDRVAMCVVAFDEFPYVEVSSIEEDLCPPSFTVSTLKALKAENPEKKIAWMIGADQLVNFSNWKSPTEILSLAALIVVPRQSQAIENLVDVANDMLVKLGCSANAQTVGGEVTEHATAPTVIVLSESPKNISSTEVRDIASRDVNGAADLIPSPVLDYIMDLGLYQA